MLSVRSVGLDATRWTRRSAEDVVDARSMNDEVLGWGPAGQPSSLPRLHLLEVSARTARWQ